MSNSVLQEQAARWALVPPQWQETKGQQVLIATEGGFRKGDRVRISDPDDYFNGSVGTVVTVPEGGSTRTCHVSLDGRVFCWCIAALVPA